jgi:aminoglycoside 3-N-acetyltransferase
MKVGLITYQTGHLTTQKVADLLLEKGYEIILFAFPFHVKNSSSFVFNSDLPPQLLGVDWKDIYQNEEVEYVEMPGWDSKHCSLFKITQSDDNLDIFLHCTSKIVPPDFIKNRIILNCHSGLLPQNRGVDSMKWSVVNTWPIGVTLHIIDEQIDRGRILARKRVFIHPEDSFQDLLNRSYYEKIQLMVDFEKFLQNRSKGWDVGDDYPLQKKRVPVDLDSQLETLFIERRKEFIRLSKDLSHHTHQADWNVRSDFNANISFVTSILSKLGVEPGSTLLFHSSFSKLSKQGYLAEDFLEGVLEFLKDGTLALPTLSWREVSPSQPNWNELNTRSNVGILSEVFRTKFADRRSLHPTHSVASIGQNTDFLLEDHHLDIRPCSEKSPWGRLETLNAQILLMDVDMDTCTLLHHLEETYAPDIFLKREIESYICESKDLSLIEVKTRRHRKLYRNFYKFRDLLERAGQLKIVEYNDYRIYGFKASDLVTIVSNEFELTSSATIAAPGEKKKFM